MDKTVVIIPTYNEAQNIASIVARVKEFAPEIKVLVVDDNSPDGTADIVRDLMKIYAGIALLSRKNKEGLGKAYLNAFAEVLKDPTIERVQIMDADFSHDPRYLPALAAVAQHVDVVIGSRYVAGGGTVNWNLKRRLLSRFANYYCRVITGMPFNDCTAGFILIDTRLLRSIALEKITCTGFAFLMELKYMLWKQGARVVEFPVIFHDRVKGSSKISNRVIREGLVAPWKMRFAKRT